MTIIDIINRERIDLAMQLDMLSKVELDIIDLALERIKDAILIEHITEIEKQVVSAYKQGYDDGHSKGFSDGLNEKEQELT